MSGTEAAVTERAAALAGSPVRHSARVGGGDIADAYRLTLADGRVLFGKALQPAPEGFFEAEAAGLGLLAGTRTVPVPDVLAAEPGLLLLSWIEPGPATPQAAEQLGRDLARLHDTPAGGYGTPWPAYIGSLPLPSPVATDVDADVPADVHDPASPADSTTPGGGLDWPRFQVEYRLLPFLRLATDNGGLARSDAADVERLCAAIDQVSGVPQAPAVIHGDLWSGNVHWSAAGGAHLIDPAAQGGHPETDLACLELFGCPRLDRILGAYAELRPIPGRRARVPLHQLHHLLVHAALFGSGYGARCGAAARAALQGGAA